MFQTLAAATGKARSPMMMMMMMRRFVKHVLNSPQRRCQSIKQVALEMLCNDRGTCNNTVDEDHRRPRDSMMTGMHNAGGRNIKMRWAVLIFLQAGHMTDN